MPIQGPMLPRAVAAAATVALAGLLAITMAPAAAPRVTLEIERAYDPDCFCYRLRFRGAISPPAAKEYVAVTQRKCGFDFATSVAGASTRADGSWTATSSVAGNTAATYRARWGRRLSKPVTVRPRLRMQLLKLGLERYRVSVNTGEARQPMTGRFVELQRLAAGSWERIRRVPLTADRGVFGSFSATFTVRKRGLRIRVVVPQKSAAPCFATTLSQTFVS
jgi:hypothetical protein